MPTTISQINICNMALSAVGTEPIDSLDTQDSIPADQCKLNWDLALGQLGRDHPWNCLMKAASLVQVVQEPIDPTLVAPASTEWAPATNYAVGAYVTFGSPAYLYQCLIANTSSASFTNDLTMGFWFQTDIYNGNSFNACDGDNYASGWSFKYPLPEDLLLLVTLNDKNCDRYEETFEVMSSDLYTEWDTAIIRYTWANPDTTRYDPMFVNCLVLKLASMICTVIRQDDTELSAKFEARYLRALSAARTKDGNEKKARRFSPTQNSRLIDSRRWSTNQ